MNKSGDGPIRPTLQKTTNATTGEPQGQGLAAKRRKNRKKDEPGWESSHDPKQEPTQLGLLIRTPCAFMRPPVFCSVVRIGRSGRGCADTAHALEFSEKKPRSDLCYGWPLPASLLPEHPARHHRLHRRAKSESSRTKILHQRLHFLAVCVLQFRAGGIDDQLAHQAPRQLIGVFQ